MKQPSAIPPDDFRNSVSQLKDQQRNRVEALAEEFVARKRAGEAVNVEQYIEQHPELATEIRELFPMMELLDRAVAAPDNEPTATAFTEIGPGTRLGEYQLMNPIGRGGMGVVYQAEHVVLGSSAAVKLLPAGLDRPKLRQRFQREASAAARMQHPNIVRVFDYGVHGETLYYVMELVEGCGLNQIISPAQGSSNPVNLDSSADLAKDETGKTVHGQQSTQPFNKSQSRESSSAETEFDLEIGATVAQFDRNKLPTSSSGHDSLWHWVAKIGVQAADAIDYAHSVGVIHRDIKPSNLMIDAEEKIYVMDFGLAKVVDDHSLTATGDILGTVRYMPPEAFRGRSDHRGDIYGLGLTLYELLTDQIAFTETDRVLLMNAISEGHFEALKKRLPAIPSDLHTIVHKALDVDPAARFQSASEFRDDLQRFIQGQPIEARRSTWLYRTNRWISRNRALTTLLTITILSLTAGLIVSSIGWSRALTAEADAKRLAKSEESARRLAQSESAAKETALEAKTKALLEKETALANEKREREYAEAIADFTRNDLLALTTVQGQHRFDEPTNLKNRGQIKTFEDLLDRAATQLNARTDLAPQVEAELKEIVGISYRINGHFDKAIALLKSSVQLFSDATGPNSTETIGAMSSLGVAYSAAKQVDDAFATYKDALDRSKLNPANEYGMPIVLASNYSNCLRQAERYDEAIKIARESLAETRVKIPDDPYYMSLSLYRLGDNLTEAGFHEEAETHLLEALKIQRDAFSNEHPYVWDTLSALSMARQGQGKLEAAEQVAREVLDLKQATLSQGHYSTAVSSSDLAFILKKSGKFDEAAGFAEKAVSGLSDSIGPDHIDTLHAMHNLGMIYFALNRTEEAIELYEEGHRLIGERIASKGLAINMRLNLAYLLADAKRYDESIKIYLETREYSEKIRGRDHPKTLRIIRDLSKAYAATKQFDTAVELNREAVALTKGRLGEESAEYKQAVKTLNDSLQLAAEAKEESAKLPEQKKSEVSEKDLKPTG